MGGGGIGNDFFAEFDFYGTVDEALAEANRINREVYSGDFNFWLRNQRQEIKKVDAERALQEERIKDLISFLYEQNAPLDAFDEALFRRVIDKMIIFPRDHIIFVFKCGMEIRETLPKR